MTGPEIVDLPATPTAVIRGTVPAAELPAFFDRSFPALAGALRAQGVAPAGAAFARYAAEPAGTVELEVGFPVDRAIEAAGDVVPGTLPAGRVARLVHTGGYDGLGTSWAGLRSWIEEQRLSPGGGFWEVYLTEPSPDADPAGLRTELNWPVDGGSGPPR